MGYKDKKLPDKKVKTIEYDLTTEKLPDKKVKTVETVSPFINKEFSEEDKKKKKKKKKKEKEKDVMKDKKTGEFKLPQNYEEAREVIRKMSATEFVTSLMSYSVHKKAGIGTYLKNNWGKILGGIGVATGIGYGAHALMSDMDENDFAEELRGIGVSETNIRNLREQAKVSGDFKSVYEQVEGKQKQLTDRMSDFEAETALNSELSMGGTSAMNSSVPGGTAPGSDLLESLDVSGSGREITPEELVNLLRMSGQDVSGLN